MKKIGVFFLSLALLYSSKIFAISPIQMLCASNLISSSVTAAATSAIYVLQGKYLCSVGMINASFAALPAASAGLIALSTHSHHETAVKNAAVALSVIGVPLNCARGAVLAATFFPPAISDALRQGRLKRFANVYDQTQNILMKARDGNDTVSCALLKRLLEKHADALSEQNSDLTGRFLRQAAATLLNTEEEWSSLQVDIWIGKQLTVFAAEQLGLHGYSARYMREEARNSTRGLSLYYFSVGMGGLACIFVGLLDGYMGYQYWSNNSI